MHFHVNYGHKIKALLLKKLKKYLMLTLDDLVLIPKTYHGYTVMTTKLKL